MAHFGQRVRSMRKQRGLTQRDLEKLSGLSNAAISLVEQGKRDPSLKTSMKLADALHTSLDWLAGRGSYRDVEQDDLLTERQVEPVLDDLVAEREGE